MIGVITHLYRINLNQIEYISILQNNLLLCLYMYTIKSSGESSHSEIFALTKSFIKDNFAAISVIFLLFYGLESLVAYYSPRSNGYLTLVISTFVQYYFLNIFKLNQANIFPGANYLFTKKKKTIRAHR